MSKRIIAGLGVVAGLAVALAPVASFATAGYDQTTQVDTLKATIESYCAFGHDFTSGDDIAVGTHANGTVNNAEAPATTTINGTSNTTAGVGAGRWNTTDANAQAADTDILYGVLENNTVQEDFGKTTLNVYCNDKTGYQIKAIGSVLDAGGAGTDIPHSVTDSTNHTLSADQSEWAFKIEAATGATNAGSVVSGYDDWSAVTTAGGTKIAGSTYNSGNTDRDGDSYVVTYGISISTSQEADTYTGTMTYTLAQAVNS